MGRTVTVRRPTAGEVRKLEHWRDDALEGPPKRRIEELLLHAQGVPATDIAHQVAVQVNTVYNDDLHAFGQEGVRAVHTRKPRGRPAQIGPKQIQTICQLAEQSPAQVGLAYSRWSLRLLQDHLLRQRVVKHISREHIRRLLKKGASTTERSSASS